MGKKSKSKGFTAAADVGRSDNYVPGWFGGTLTSPIAQKLAKSRLKDTLRERVLLFEAARRSGSDADNSAPTFGR
jgi:hypothetical protein